MALKPELIIPSYNRLHILRENLKRIRILYPELRICLGLQGEMPDSDFRRELDLDTNLRLEIMMVPGTAATLNHCIRTSAADIALILDDDAVPHFGWMEAHIAAFTDDPELAYTSGREIRFSQGQSSFSEFMRILAESCMGAFLASDTKIKGRIVGWTSKSGLIFGNFDQPGVSRINAPRGCNMAVRKDDFLSQGGFNEQFRGNAWGFEAEFGYRMARAGKYGRYQGDGIVVHYEVPSGGSRNASRSGWYDDFLFNHTLLIRQVGPQAWLGSLPRLLKKLILR